MAESNGTPIRLVQENGNLIELEATTFALTTERQVTPTSYPATGGVRIAIDLNKSRSLIVMQGVITDDRFTTGAAFAKGLIDFSSTVISYNRTTINTNRYYAANTFVTSSNIDALLAGTSKFQVKSTDGTLYEATFTQDSSLGRTGNNIAIKTNGGTYATTTQFTSYVADWVNNQTASKLTASIVTSEFTGLANSAILIKQNVSGEGGNQSAYPRIVVSRASLISPNNYQHPINPQKFQGGSTGKKKSAGDKAMDLYGIINNSSREINRELTVDNLLTSLGSLAAALPTAGLSLLNNLTGDGDYIVGIQIPYNSTIQADGDTYVARNFFMPTGVRQSRFSKTSEANISPAGATFDIRDTGFTGIQGVMGKLDITYDAGESVYNFDITFYPADATI
jgi:hypothetical protein